MFYFADVTNAHVFKIIQISTGGMLMLQVLYSEETCWIWNQELPKSCEVLVK